MREILFRANFRKISSGEECMQQAAMCKGKIVNPLEQNHLSGYIQTTEWEQYTGLLDKNGVRIFEGDRIRYHTTIECGVGVVATFGKCNNLGIEWEHQDTESPSIFDPLFYFQCESELEIIGTIHK